MAKNSVMVYTVSVFVSKCIYCPQIDKLLHGSQLYFKIVNICKLQRQKFEYIPFKKSVFSLAIFKKLFYFRKEGKGG